VLPLFHPGRRTAPFKAEPFPVSARRRTLRATANWYTPLYGPVAEDEAALEALAATVVAGGAALISLGFLPDEPAGAAPLRAAAVRAGYRLHQVPLPPVPYVAVDGDWRTYEQRVSSRLLRDLRRRRRRLESQGPVTVQVLDGTDRLDELLAEGFRLEASGWKAERGSAILSRPATQRFYTDVARWASARGWLRLAFLRVAERPIAFQLGIEANGTYYFLKGGYDPDHHAAAPAKLLLQAMLERAHELPLDRFDFVGGDEPWKLEWTDTCREREVLHAFAPSAAGELERLAVTVGRPARARVRSSVRGLRPAMTQVRRWLRHG
jgi:CelD/BcsL family acetyltransferase involved in cellulose biosynthesis